VAVCLAVVVGSATTALADEGWTITSFDSAYTVQADGLVRVVETIRVDFGAQQKHGIFRYLPESAPCAAPQAGVEQPLTPCPDGSDREWKYSNITVTDGAGARYGVSQSTENGNRVLKIGDADRTISGAHTYVISYTVQGALDAFSDHDELYWNALGSWPVRVEAVSVAVTLPDGAKLTTACYEGPPTATSTCPAAVSGATATFHASAPLNEDEQVTIVAGWQRGLVNVQPPIITRQKTAADFFTGDILELGGAVVVAVGAFGLLILLWWRHGRDRRYRSLYYLTNDPSEETTRPFAHRDIVVEFLPPDGLRPAQMGVILDERADTLDVTATIVDLAVRGYLHITEIPKDGFFGHTDWTLDKVERESDLQPYEATLYAGLFEDGTTVKLSELKNKFVARLAKVKEGLYKDAMKRKWFSVKPETARAMWAGVGVAMVVVGLAAAFATGYFFGRLLIPVPLAVAGVVMLILSRAMSRRTATGSEALRRVLGFRLYISTAETRQQEFNEQQNIFARYLPFAIVFGCVGKWAKAFEGLDDVQASTSSWYSSSTPFQVAAFSAGLQGFSSSVSSTIASSPSSSGSGGSGFGGGFSGGGGGGGGGGSW
jgi:uncharacterized membrane protein YgcG